MKRFLLLVCGMFVGGSVYAASGPSISGTGGMNSNAIYNLIITYSVGSTGGIPSFAGFGTNTTLRSPTLTTSNGVLKLLTWNNARIGFTNTSGSYFVFDGNNILSELPSGNFVLSSADPNLGVIYANGFNGNGAGISNAVDLVAGANVTITPSDGNRTFTIASTGGGGSSSTNFVNDGSDIVIIDTNGVVRMRFTASDNLTRIYDSTGVNVVFEVNPTSTTMKSPDGNAYVSAQDGGILVFEPAISGSGIATSAGKGTNTDLLNPSYRGNLLSTNAYPIVRATVTVPPDSAQTWQQIYSGDADAAPFSFVASAVTNNFNPAVNDASPFSGLSDVQLHYGYNLSGAGYKSSLPQWVRGFESTWFNSFQPPVIEVYDRVVLTNSAANPGGDVGFGYTMALQDGTIAAAVSSHTLEFRNPRTTLKWLDLSVNSTNGQGVMLFTKGRINTFQNTNEWLISDADVGVLGMRGSNYLFSGSGGGNEMVTILKGANTSGSLLGIQFGSITPRGMRWNGTNGTQRFERQTDDGLWHAFNDIPETLFAGGDAFVGNRLSVTNKTGGDGGSVLFGTTRIADTRLTVDVPSGHFAADGSKPAIGLSYNGSTTFGRIGMDDHFGLVIENPFAGDTAGLFLKTTGTNRIVITQLGKVGINTNNPQATLHVNGTVQAGIAPATTAPAFKSTVTNNAVLRCPDGGSWILRIANDGVLSTVTNTAGL